MNLSRDSRDAHAVHRSQPAAHWSLWLLLTGLLAFGGFVALPSLQATLPETVAGPADRALADQWQQQRWLVSSRDVLKPQAADRQADLRSPPQPDVIWLAAASMLLPVLVSIAITGFTPTQLPALRFSTLSGAPRGPPSSPL